MEVLKAQTYSRFSPQFATAAAVLKFLGSEFSKHFSRVDGHWQSNPHARRLLASCWSLVL
eukprot:6174651-Amphidinium_carterae.1